MRTDGYLPLEDYGLIGDGSTAALVGRDGSVDWLCIPRFDSAAIFCGLLDPQRGGAFSVRPDELVDATQRYDGDTAVLVTELRSPTGVLRLTDALAVRGGVDLAEDAAAGRGELVRIAEAVDGTVSVRVEVEPRGGADVSRASGGLVLGCHIAPELLLNLTPSRPLDGLPAKVELAAGERLALVLRWASGSSRFHELDPEQVVRRTKEAWERWAQLIHYDGPWAAEVRRSAITLKLLDHFANGAIVAAPTSSLPEDVGGVRNWDYRYVWIRDAAFTVYALRRIGLEEEASSFLGWVLGAIERHERERPKVLYDVDGLEGPPEVEDHDLAGYLGSRPVRWGNGASDQRQHDVYGEVLDCAYQWARGGGRIDDHLWQVLCSLIDGAEREWREPDHGIWEVRNEGNVFTYSAALCHVALDRGARLAETLGLPGRPEQWRREAARIRDAILEEAWDEERQAITEHLGAGGGLDASVLALPLRRVLEADHPKMVATTAAVADRLGAGDGLLYRYLPEESPDGLEGDEGAFLLCSFWLVDNLAKQGRLDEAGDLLGSLCGRASPLGLFSEQIDPSTGAFLGNFPQAFSHIGLIGSALNLARATR